MGDEKVKKTEKGNEKKNKGIPVSGEFWWPAYAAHVSANRLHLH